MNLLDYEMIIDYYEKHPDPNVQMIKMPEMEKGEQGGRVVLAAIAMEINAGNGEWG